MNCSIYTLSNPITNEIKYVGFTSLTLDKRLKSHMHDSKRRNTHLYCWIRKLKQNNLMPTIELLDVCDMNNWRELECYWIYQLRTWGFNLTNLAEGGMGNPIMNKETKRKISEALKGKSSWNKGIPCSIETKKKLSKVLTGRIHSKESRKKMSISQTGRKASEQTKKLMSSKQKGRKDTRSFQAKRNQILSLSKPVFQFTKNNEFINEWESAVDAYENTQINKSHIGECCNGKRKSAGGFIWKFKN